MNELDERLQIFLGCERGPYNSWDAVNQPMIRHWCDALGDANPVYTNPGFAVASVHGHIVAPPTMMQAWSMRGLTGRSAPGSDQRDPFEIFRLLDDAGYRAVVAVNCEQNYHRYLRIGDRIWYASRIESVSPCKTTTLGSGYFITEFAEYRDQNGERVGDMRFRLFKYRAAEPFAATDAEVVADPCAPE